MHEAHRVLKVGGKLCLVSLTRGTTFLSQLVSSLWTSLFRLRPSLLGGCRPISLDEYGLNPNHWQLEYRKVIISFGVPSEASILTKKQT